MRKEDILLKGTYIHPQPSDLLSVKQYIIAKVKDKKALFLRFSNDRGETATAMSLRVTQYDVKGDFISSEKIELKRLKAAPLATFTLKDSIVIADNCVDFRVDIITASYGDYIYDVIDGEAHIRYAKEEEENKNIDIPQLRKSLGGRNQRVSVKTLKVPSLLVVICSILLLSVFCFVIVQLGLYMYVETCFTLDNFDYEFLTDNKDDGPIKLTKYHGYAMNIVIPEEIEGYRIASIGQDAFSNNSLYTISIEGNVTIEYSAFSHCYNLYSVDMPHVKKIDAFAFSYCANLSSINLGDSINVIEKYAFVGCSSIENVLLPEGLETIGEGAFSSCSNLKSFIIPNSVKSIGNGVISNSSPYSLSVPYIVNEEAGVTGLCYFYGVDSNQSIMNVPLEIAVTNQDEIKEKSFIYCETLRSVEYTLPVKSIGDDAFNGCISLCEFEIDQTVTNIGRGAFYQCHMLDGITIPDGIKNIAELTFYGCQSLSSIEIPESVKHIKNNAFSGCNSLRTLTVPKTVESIGAGAFADCRSLVDVSLPFMGFSADDSVPAVKIFGVLGANNIAYLKLTNVKSLSEDAFAGLVALEDVYLSETLEEVGARAFENCVALKQIVIPDTVSYMGDYAFSGCSSLTNIKIPEGLTNISEGQFMNCSALLEIDVPKKVVQINNFAFKGCSLASEVLLPDSLESIGEEVFAECGSLTAINMPIKVTEVNRSAFEGCVAIEKILWSNNITYIGERAFAGCSALTSVNLPEELNKIDSEAFAECTSLKSLDIHSGVTELGIGILRDCNSLESLSVYFMSYQAGEEGESGQLGYFFTADGTNNDMIPQSLKTVTLNDVKVLSSYAFSNCSYINKVNLPSSLTNIQEFAFYGCSALKEMTVPNSVTNIGESVFLYCDSLETLSLPFIGTNYNDLRSIHSLFEYNVPSSLKKVTVTNAERLADGCFSDCSYIEEVDIQSNLISIPYGAFRYCRSLKNVTIPESVTAIRGEAFSACTELRSITLPSQLVTIENAAFSCCYKLYEVYDKSSYITITNGSALNGEIGLYAINVYVNDEEPIRVSSNGFDFVKKKNTNDWYLVSYSLDNGVCTLPNSFSYGGTKIEGYTLPRNLFRNDDKITSFTGSRGVNSIGNNLFNSCTYLTSADLSDMVIDNIPEYAFSWCSSLSSVKISSATKTIESYAFCSCYELTSINFSSNLETIGGYAFESCGSLNKIDFNNATKVKTIGNYAFAYCAALESVKFPNSLENIGEYAFGNCGIKTIDFSNATKVKTIGNYAFAYCMSLKSVKFPNSLENIGEYAFEKCNIKTIDLSNATSFKTIGYYAFADCAALESVKLPESLTSIGSYAFEGCTKISEIWNPGTLGITAGSRGYGQVALYAIVVHDDINDMPLTFSDITKNGVTYKFAYDGNTEKYYLIGAQNYNGNDVFTFPKVSNMSYTVCRHLSNDISYAGKILITNDIVAIEKDFFGNLYASKIYYMGTELDWATNFSNIGYLDRLYTYVECKHEEGNTWMWLNGNISDDIAPTIQNVLEAPTCAQLGRAKVICCCCEEILGEIDVPKLPHSFNSEDFCVECNQEISMEDRVERLITYSSPYTFTKNSDGKYVSNNQGKEYTIAQMTFTANQDMVVTISYSVSSERNYDKLYIYHEDVVAVGGVSGTISNATIRIELKAGDTVVFQYSKDGSVNNGSDCATINSIIIS